MQLIMEQASVYAQKRVKEGYTSTVFYRTFVLLIPVYYFVVVATSLFIIYRFH